MASSVEEQILRASKEITVKFIETGRISPTNFTEHFEVIHNTIKKTVLQDGKKDNSPQNKSADPDNLKKQYLNNKTNITFATRKE